MRIPVLVCLFLALTACGGSEKKEAAPSDGPSASVPVPVQSTPPPDCVQNDKDAKVLTDENGATVIVWGSGERGVLMAPQIRNTACGWDEEAHRLAKKGYHVAVLGWKRGTEENALVPAAKLLYGEGAKKIVTIGASAGGAAVIEQSAAIDPPVAGVIGVSPVSVYGGGPGTAALKSPLLLLASELDPGASLDDVKSFGAAHPGKERLVVYKGVRHGVSLVDSTPAAQAEILAFVRQRLG